MKPSSTGVSPIVAVTVPVRATSRNAATPASTPEIANAAAMTRFARTPSSRHAEIFGRRAHFQAEAGGPQQPGQAAEQERADEDGDDLQALQAEAENFDLAAQRGKEVDALRTRADEEDHHLLHEEADGEGGNEERGGVSLAQRPEGGALGGERQHDRRDEAAGEHDRERLPEQREQRVAGGHDQLAMGEVDEPHHAKNQPDAERGQRIEAADADRIDERLRQPVHQRAARAFMLTPKYAASKPAFSASAAGVPSSTKAPPFMT
jgi:hypothetical protein